MVVELCNRKRRSGTQKSQAHSPCTYFLFTTTSA